MNFFGRGFGRLRSMFSAILFLSIAVSHPLTPAQIVVEGGCTLVDAISSANQDAAIGGCTAGSADDEIVLTTDVVLTDTVDGENGLPAITSGITLRGNGFEVSRDPQAPEFRILAVPHSGSTGEVALEDVTLSGGFLPAGDGGAIWMDSRSAFLVLTSTTLSGNQAQRGGALYIGQGGYGSYRQVDVVDSRITYNQANEGGGIFKAYGGYLDLVSSTLSGNTASGRGGGLSTTGGWYPFGQPGYSYVTDSTISGNAADDGGGINAFGGLRLTNSTVSENYASTVGGGLATLTGNYEPNRIIFSTITGNSTGSGLGGGLYNTTSGFVADELFVESSIIAGNADTNCVLDSRDIDGSGANFDDDGTCGEDWNLMTGLDPSLQDNGGPTQTHALLDGSSAVDAAGPCGVATDQRGFLRNDGSCDSGAFEQGAGVLAAQGVCPGPTTVSANGATADTRMLIYQGVDRGDSQVPSGVCAGTDFDITGPHIVGFFPTDADGQGSVVLDFTEADCSDFLQGVTEIDCTPTNVVQIDDDCNFLDTSHTGDGSDPQVAPASSPGCLPDRYVEGELISLTAFPDPAWGVAGWNGTDNDSSTDEVNSLTMPAEDHVVSVDYVKICKPLTVSKTGTGANPQTTPLNSPGCPTSQYIPGELIRFSGAIPFEGWVVGGWTGTDDDSSTASSNTLTMPDVESHIVTVDYRPNPDPIVSLSGTCPGQVDVTVTNATPSQRGLLYAGSAGGTTQIPGGACAGTELDLSPARRWKTFTADGAGQAFVSFTASAAWCSRSVQAVDFVCSTSNVADMP